MFSNLRISTRLALGIFAILLGIILAVLSVSLMQLREVTGNSETRELDALYNTLLARVQNDSSLALIVTATAVNANGVIDAFARKDREKLLELTAPVYAALMNGYGISQFQFHLPPATSFLRVHQPAKFGDDLQTFRATVVKTNETREPQSGLESGVAGIGLRGVIPVYNHGMHIGSAEIGLSFGQDFFNTFTKQYNAPSALHIRSKDKDGFKVFATTIPMTTTISPQQAEEIMNGLVIKKTVNFNNREWALMAKAVPDFSGKPVAVAEIMIDRTEFAVSYRNMIYNVLGIGAIGLLIGLFLAGVLSRNVTQSILKENAGQQRK